MICSSLRLRVGWKAVAQFLEGFIGARFAERHDGRDAEVVHSALYDIVFLVVDDPLLPVVVSHYRLFLLFVRRRFIQNIREFDDSVALSKYLAM